MVSARNDAEEVTIYLLVPTVIITLSVFRSQLVVSSFDVSVVVAKFEVLLLFTVTFSVPVIRIGFSVALNVTL